MYALTWLNTAGASCLLGETAIRHVEQLQLEFFTADMSVAIDIKRLCVEKNVSFVSSAMLCWRNSEACNNYVRSHVQRYLAMLNMTNPRRD